MKTRVQITSVEAFHRLVNKEGQAYRIFLHIEENAPVSIGETAKALGLEKSTCAARFNELANGKKVNGVWVKSPVIEQYGKLTDAVSGVRTIHWQVLQQKPVEQEMYSIWSNL